MNNKLLLSTAILVSLSACGGGGGGGGSIGSDPTLPPPAAAGCISTITAGYNGPSPGEGEGGSDGGDGVGEGNGDGIGAGGALGRFRDVGVRLIRLDTNETVEGRSDDLGRATISACSGSSPHRIEFFGIEGSRYWDEAKEDWQTMLPGETFAAVVPHMRRQFVGITAFSNAASQINDNANAAARLHTKGVVAKNDAASISSANKIVSQIVSDQIPGTYRADTVTRDFEVTSLPVALDDTTDGQRDSIPDNSRGRYSAVNAAFAHQSGEFLPNDRRPALTAAVQLARDFTDGKLDLLDANGCSIATPLAPDAANGEPGPVEAGTCQGASGEQMAYTYDSLWRAKTVATSTMANRSGVQSLADRKATIAEYKTVVQQMIEVQQCIKPNGEACSAPFHGRSDINQLVQLTSRGELTVQRDAGVAFANGIDWQHVTTTPQKIDGSFTDVRVGRRGQIVALHQDRLHVTYLAAREPYQPSGTEANTAEARAALQNRLAIGQPTVLTLDQPVVNIAIPADNRTMISGLSKPVFVLVYGNGRIGHYVSGNSLETRQLPFGVNALVYDKFVPPVHNAAYGPAYPAASLPFNGPRRLFMLTRTGTVRVVLEGATTAQGVELPIPGRVVQLAAESLTNIYALSSDGKVYWINADQAQGQASPVVEIPVPEAICWIARSEAVACGSGAVYSWPESRREVRYGTTTDTSTQSVTFMPAGVGAAVQRQLNNVKVWRLNAVEEFYQISDTDGSFRSGGIRYLPVDGAPFDPTGVTDGSRNLQNSSCSFDGATARPYLMGWQIHRGLLDAMNRLSTGTSFDSNGQNISKERLSADISASQGFRATLSSQGSGSLPVPVAQDSSIESNCQQNTDDSSRFQFASDPAGQTLETEPLPDIAQMISAGFSVADYQLQSSILLKPNATHPDLPAFTMGMQIGHSSNEFFINVNRGLVDGLSRSPRRQISIWRDDARFPLDATLKQWFYQYGNDSTGIADPLEIYERVGEGQCDTGAVASTRCMVVSMLTRAVFGDPSKFRICFDQSFNTLKTRSVRLTCTLHRFDGSMIDTNGSTIEPTMQVKWSHPPRLPPGPINDIDFGFLLAKPDNG